MEAAREPLGRRDAVAALVLAGALLLAGAQRLVPGVVGVFHDDAVYVATAKALAEGGGYRLINLPGAPPQTKYPILYPAALALVWRCAASLPARLVAMQIATLGAAALAIAGAYLYVVRFRYVGRPAAFAAGALCASSPNVLYYATLTLSEMPFALAVVASLWTTDAYLRDARARAGRGLLTGAVSALPFLCRSVGAVVPLAAIVVAARARRPLRGMIGGALVLGLPWIAWAAQGVGSLAADPITGYQQDYLGHWSTRYFGASGSASATALAIFAANVVKASIAVGAIAFEGLAHVLYAATDRASMLLAVGGAAAWLVALRGAPRRLLPATLLAYLLLVCAWPWPPDRFVVPLLFFVLALALGAVGRTAARFGAGRAVVAPGLISVIALLGVYPNLRVLADYVTASRHAHYPYFMLPGEPVAWSSYDDAFTWLATHSTPDTVLAAGFDSMTALYTGRPTIRPFVPRPSALYYAQVTGEETSPLGPPDELARALVAYRVRYLFVSPMPAFPEEDAFYELLTRVLTERPGLLRPAYRGEDPRFVVFEVAPP